MIENIELLTDLYQLTMAEGYFKHGLFDTKASFYMSFRENPFEGGYTVACGMEQIVEIVEQALFTDEDIDYLSTLKTAMGKKIFSGDFLSYLKGRTMNIDVDCVKEGTVVFPYEPIVRVTGSLAMCQLIETSLLNAINFETLIATKAARICSVAKGSVAEFGLRRAQGSNGGLLAARAAIIGGCSSTSNVLAGKLYGIPVSGTHAHSWVLSFDSELEAFRAFAEVMPHNAILLVDTYDVIGGVKNAIIVGNEMKSRGEKLVGIRLDSGDLAWESRQARKMLDEAGLEDVKIIASNNLDEYTIQSLDTQGACIDSYGVGTKLVTAYDQPALGGVYKLSAISRDDGETWMPRFKITEQTEKRTIPGVLGVMRYVDSNGRYIGDRIYDTEMKESSNIIVSPTDPTKSKKLLCHESFDLLEPLVRGGKRLIEKKSPIDIQARVKEEMEKLDPAYKRFLNPGIYFVGLDLNLHDLRSSLIWKNKLSGN